MCAIAAPQLVLTVYCHMYVHSLPLLTCGCLAPALARSPRVLVRARKLCGRRGQYCAVMYLETGSDMCGKREQNVIVINR
jgi:hypothetical protein